MSRQFIKSNMTNQFKSFLSAEAMVDVTLDCAGQSLKAHRIVLSAYSPFFKSLFLKNPCKHPIVILKDMQFTELKLVIDFMYCGEVNIAEDQLSSVIKIAQTLRVKGLGEVEFENSQSNGETENPSGNVSKSQSGETLCFKWNNHMNVLNEFKTFLASETMVDVTLGCDGQSLKAHKIVLSAYNSFFRSLFLENSCRHPIVILKDMKYTELKSIIDFMYCGEVNLAENTLSALVKAARTLESQNSLTGNSVGGESKSQSGGATENSVGGESKSQSGDASENSVGGESKSQSGDASENSVGGESKSQSGDASENSFGGESKNQSGDELPHEPICMIDVSNWTLTQRRALIDQNVDGSFATEIKQENISDGMDVSVSHTKTSTVPLQSHDANPCLKSKQDQPVEQNVDKYFALKESFEVSTSNDISQQILTTNNLPRQSFQLSPQSNMEFDEECTESTPNIVLVTSTAVDNQEHRSSSVSASKSLQKKMKLKRIPAKSVLQLYNPQKLQVVKKLQTSNNGKSLILDFILTSLRDRTFSDHLKWDPMEPDRSVFMLKWARVGTSVSTRKETDMLLAWDRLEGRPEAKNAVEFVASRERFREALKQEKTFQKGAMVKRYQKFKIVDTTLIKSLERQELKKIVKRACGKSLCAEFLNIRNKNILPRQSFQSCVQSDMELHEACTGSTSNLVPVTSTVVDIQELRTSSASANKSLKKKMKLKKIPEKSVLQVYNPQKLQVINNGKGLILDFILTSLRDHTFGNCLKWDPKDHDHSVFRLKWPHKHISAWTESDVAVLLAWDRLEGRPEAKNSSEFQTSKERFQDALRQEKNIRKLHYTKGYEIYEIVDTTLIKSLEMQELKKIVERAPGKSLWAEFLNKRDKNILPKQSFQSSVQTNMELHEACTGSTSNLVPVTSTVVDIREPKTSSAIISLEAILKFFEDQKSLVIEGGAKVDASDIQAFSFDPENQLIVAQVYTTMKDKIYTVMIRLDEKQMIQEWSCECTEGSDKCHHMAAALIYASEHRSSMDQPCRWNVVKQPQKPKSCEESFGIQKKNYLKRKSTADDKNFFFPKLKKHAPESGLTWFISPEPETVLKTCSKPHVDEILNSSSFASAENKIAYFLNKICVTKEEIAEVFSATEGQRDNPLWGMYHKGRITSSNFGSVLRALHEKQISPRLIKSLNGEYSLDNVKSIKSLISHKASAVKLFTEIKKKNVGSGGIFLHSSGLLGCSPDGLVGETDILEIKCPFLKCDVDILKEMHSNTWCVKYTSATFNADLYQSGNFSVYDFKLGDIIFNLEHPLGWNYHHQIQGMLHIMDKDICHVLIWTPKTSLLFPIAKEGGWKKNLETLLSFYKNVYVHNIIK